MVKTQLMKNEQRDARAIIMLGLAFSVLYQRQKDVLPYVTILTLVLHELQSRTSHKCSNDGYEKPSEGKYTERKMEKLKVPKE